MSKYMAFLCISYHEYGHKFEEAELKAAAMLFLQSRCKQSITFTHVDADVDIRSRVQQVIVHVDADYPLDLSDVEISKWHDYIDYMIMPHPRIIFESYYQRTE